MDHAIPTPAGLAEEAGRSWGTLFTILLKPSFAPPGIYIELLSPMLK
jgi:hypothetical protein